MILKRLVISDAAPSYAASLNCHRQPWTFYLTWTALLIAPFVLVAASVHWWLSVPANSLPLEFHQAWEALENGRVDEAEKHLESVMRQPHQGAPYLVLDAGLSLYRRDFDAAEKRIHVSDPNGALRPYALEVLGKSLHGQQRWYDAERAFATLAHEIPLSFVAHFWLGVVYNELHMFGQAVHELRLASELRPNDPRPGLLLGSIHFRHGQYRTAAEQYEQALRSIPPDAMAKPESINPLITSLAKSLVLGNQFEEALQKIALVSDPPAELQVLRAECFLGLGRLAEAERECRRVLEHDENQQAAVITLVKGGLQQTVTAEHARLLEEVLKKNPNASETVFLLAQVYGQLGNAERQQELLSHSQHLVKLQSRIQSLMDTVWAQPQDVTSRLELAKIFDEIGDAAQAKEWREAAAGCQHRIESIKRNER